MEKPKVYLSFDYENNQKGKEQFVEESTNSNVEFIVEHESREPNLPPNQWENVVSDQINYVNMVIILVGKETAQTSHIAKEISAAVSQNIPIFGIYVEGCGPGTALPRGLASNRVIDFDWNAISNMIEKAMKEGKNELLGV